MNYVYVRSEQGLWTTGFYAPDGTWNADKDFTDREEAAKRVHWLNGGGALSAVRDAAKAYYDFTREPDPQGFNHQYNMRAIRVGEALFAALEQVK